MIKNLRQYRRALRSVAITITALAFAITLSTALAGDAQANGPQTARRLPAASSNAAKKSSNAAKKSPFVKKPAITGLVNINTATVAQLQKLPGVGPSKAKRIVEYRDKRGRFARVRDLRRVKGIGRKTLERMSKHLTVKGETTAR